MIQRLKNALAALRGVTNVTNVIAPPAVELLELQPDDKLVLCYTITLSSDMAARLRDAFDAALKGDSQVIVLGDEIPKFFIVRGLELPPGDPK